MNSDSKRERPLQILSCHVDAFYLAFKGEVSGNTRSMLNARLALATNVGTGVVVDIGESEFELSPDRGMAGGSCKMPMAAS